MKEQIKQARHGEREVLTDPNKLVVKHEHNRFFINYGKMVFSCTKCKKEFKLTSKNISQLKKIKEGKV